MHSELSSASRLSNLIDCYDSTDLKKQIYSFSESDQYLDIRNLAKVIIEQDFERVIFLSTSSIVFNYIDLLVQLGYCGSFIFHVDENFVASSKQWIKLSDLDCHFVCSSNRQLEFVRSFLSEPAQASLLSPVVKKNIELVAASKLRKKMNIADDELVLLYHGDLSRQQHIIELTSLVLKFCAQISPKVNLWLCGQFKDVGIPLVGKTELEYEHYQSWLQLCRESPYGHKVVHLGEVESDQLADLYAGADWGVFLGSDPAVDFDHAALCALSHGLPCVLSDWAGHSDLVFDGFVRTLPVKVSGFHLSPDLKRFTKDLFLMLNKSSRSSSDVKSSCAKHYQTSFSSANASVQLKKILNIKKPFKGFNLRMEQLAAAFERNPYAPFVDVTSYGGYNQEFEDIYASYFGHT
tara:strand:+ start:7111 stop:8331 length:1221 start_codon:yes stop_codon:yes gene_type:complete